MVLPTAMLTACDVGVPPAVDEVVEVYDGRTGTWSMRTASEHEAGDVGVGGELLHDGHLFRVGESGLVELGGVDAEALADADAVFTGVEEDTEWDGSTWVVVLGDGDTGDGHARLADVEPGVHVAFQGRVFYAADADGQVEVMRLGDVLWKVVNIFVPVAPEVIDAEIGFVDGSTEVLTGTPNHPF